MRTPVRSILLAAAIAAAPPLSGCAPQAYRAEPLEPAQLAADFNARRSDDGALRAFMARHGYVPSGWPPAKWTLRPLTLMAIYFHPDMDIARANLEIQRAAEITAGQRPNPGITPGLEHHSNIHNGPVTTPWSIGVGFDIPIETGGKREARIARAQQLSETARLAIGEAAWNVRSRLRERMINVYAAEAGANLWETALALHRQEIELLERFFKGGEASPADVSQAHLNIQSVQMAAASAGIEIETARAGLAEALGLPFDEVKPMAFDYSGFHPADPPAFPGAAIQQSALENRLDLQSGLARYAAAEASLREEIAKQYPDFSIQPGFLWDQGDLVKSLAATVMLPFLNLNEGPIAEAEARRKLEAARYKSLQAGAFAKLAEARVRYAAAVKRLQTGKELVAKQIELLADAKRLQALGELSRLSAVEAEIELNTARRAELDAHVAMLHAWGAVEDAVQRPLDEIDFEPDGGSAAPEAGPS